VSKPFQGRRRVRVSEMYYRALVLRSPEEAQGVRGARPGGSFLRGTEEGLVVDPTGVAAMLVWDRLWAMCARMRCPAARALRRESSPAITAAAMTDASVCAFFPGWEGWAPFTPRRSKQPCCGARTVPPPTVPTSMQGMETVIRRSSPPLVLYNTSVRSY
jgi:hypothetical protein